MDRIGRPLLQFPGQWGYHCYEPRIYRTLAKILRNIEVQDFETLITDYITFVKRPQYLFWKHVNHEFTEICANTILYWIFTRKRNPDLVGLLLKKTREYWQDRSCSLALILGTFTPVYCPCPPSGITPLLYVAQTRQSSILQILLQYGILEREKNPKDIVFKIVFYPSRIRIMDDHELVDIQEDAKLCLLLCSRVLRYIPVSEFEKQQHFGRNPIIPDWLDYIPPGRYKSACELLHLCRMAIRKQLLPKNMLPDGIFILPLPAFLQHYLNLEK
ncbi:ankyrin repeat and SOCS box protein 17 isoform X2 [Ambystoma mexicanum]|uniref:ankyrin repeat and SOCS box protein 17 isoform X2 n=1 Tax=Ambystoma mexicanum TaxID=8296 RepID=UPI0037E989B2